MRVHATHGLGWCSHSPLSNFNCAALSLLANWHKWLLIQFSERMPIVEFCGNNDSGGTITLTIGAKMM